MSQRGCAGSNRPPATTPAEEPVSISPEAVNRAGPTICVARFKSSPWPLRHSPAKKSDTALALYLRVSEALGVGQPASAA